VTNKIKTRLKNICDLSFF